MHVNRSNRNIDTKNDKADIRNVFRLVHPIFFLEIAVWYKSSQHTFAGTTLAAATAALPVQY
jgi:hypothetical protein